MIDGKNLLPMTVSPSPDGSRLLYMTEMEKPDKGAPAQDKDEEEKKKCWNAFRTNEDWNVLKNNDRYADTVSKIHSKMLEAYSNSTNGLPAPISCVLAA